MSALGTMFEAAAAWAFGRTTSGIDVVMPTPLTRSGDVDHRTLDRLVGFCHEAGANGLTILGQLGEAPKPTVQESEAIVQRRAVPIFHSGRGRGVSAGVASMAELSNLAMSADASGAMIVPHHGLRTDDQIVVHYQRAVGAIGTQTPFIIQDYPLTFSVTMSPKVIAVVANNHATCTLLRHEDWPGLERMSTLRTMEARAEIPRLSILGGNGGLFLDFELRRGSDGAMTGYCVPELLVRVVALHRTGNHDGAAELFDAHLPLIRYEQQPGVGPAVRKYVLARRGVIDCDLLRTPGASYPPVPPMRSRTCCGESVHVTGSFERMTPHAAMRGNV